MKLLDQQYTQPALKAFKSVSGSTSSLAIQPITEAHLRAAKKAGGDAIDLDPSIGTFISTPYIFPLKESKPLTAADVLINVSWQNEADDAKVNAFVKKFLTDLDAAAKRRNLHVPFTFLNDAQSGQEVFNHYGGGKSLRKLQKTARKYDPKGVFQKLETGGFKLPGRLGY